MALWGVGMGVQESIVRAAVADLVPGNRRAGAYGVFDTGFGIFWFLGSALMGILYDRSIHALVVFSVAAQLAALPLLLVVASKARTTRG
jgi:MFS family permease